MRKNIAKVLSAFALGRAHSEATCSTNGVEVYSYALCIARKENDGTIWVLDRGPSVTTNSQINAVRSFVPRT